MMADHLSADRRSRLMSSIRGKNTKPEISVRKLLHAMGYRFRLHRKDLPGKPDIVLPKYKKVVFVNGCFWHGHRGCKRAMTPKTRTEFWREKIQGNISRDRRNLRELEKVGYEAMTIWECEIKDSETVSKKLDRFLKS
jgi:DNA mismatch endonuclease, patch repair protein